MFDCSLHVAWYYICIVLVVTRFLI
jgi:hypothetical protein